MTQLTINQLTCNYENQPVIQNLSLKLAKNEIIALLGPSGCGKTTLLKAVAGLQSIHEGEIKIADKLVTSPSFVLPSEKRKIGMIFQDYALFPHMNVIDNIAFGIHHLSKEKQQQISLDMLKMVKLENFAKRFPYELSGGQQQRVAIARALAHKPELMLLDEPFSNIDSQSRTEIMFEIRSILKQQKVAAIFVTHSKDEAFIFADKVAIFNHGKIEQFGSAQDLYSRPVSDYVASFMGKTNYLSIINSHKNEVKTRIGKISCNNTESDFKNKKQLMLRPEQLKILPANNSDFKILNRFFCGGHWNYHIIDIREENAILEAYSSKLYANELFVTFEVKDHSLVTY